MRWGEWRTQRLERKMGRGNDSLHEKGEMEVISDAFVADRAVSARGRRSVESYLGGAGSTLRAVGSRTTVGGPPSRAGAMGNGGVRRGSEAKRPGVQERISTGFKMRQSLDVERGL